MRRHLLPTAVGAFDFRASSLTNAPAADAALEVIENFQRSREQLIEFLSREFGSDRIQSKVENFAALGALVPSIYSYHTELLIQCRAAYVMGCYYPALTAACALGERLLNHLMIDLRDSFKGTPEYAKVHRKKSFDYWPLAIDTLESWEVFATGVADEFRKLNKLRNDSLHFNMRTYANLRTDALTAVTVIQSIVAVQYSWFITCPWIIAGTQGQAFLKQEAVSLPFIQKYYLPSCPPVGPLFAMANTGEWSLFDYIKYPGEREVTDEEFAAAFNSRTPDQLVPTDVPVRPNVKQIIWRRQAMEPEPK